VVSFLLISSSLQIEMSALTPGRDAMVKTPKKSVLVRVPVRVVSVALELRTIEERHQTKPIFFRRGDYRNKGHNLEISVLGSISGEDAFSVFFN
jgi:hypothetical protein